MPRQRIYHNRRTKAFPEDFSERLKRFHEESGLSCRAIARRLRDLTGPHHLLIKIGKQFDFARPVTPRRALPVCQTSTRTKYVPASKVVFIHAMLPS